jgi:hypothetical protein
MQDGAPGRTSRTSTEFPRRRASFPKIGINSPDINPIDMIWGVMKKTFKYGAELYPSELLFYPLCGNSKPCAPKENIARVCGATDTNCRHLRNMLAARIRSLVVGFPKEDRISQLNQHNSDGDRSWSIESRDYISQCDV